jgi:ribonucleoside-diphosphate reductase alpha chain
MVDPYKQQIVLDVWKEKYSTKGEVCIDESFKRVVEAIIPLTVKNKHREKILQALKDRHQILAGRVLSGAGSSKRVTLLNCFVSPKIEDSLDSIMDCLATSAFTQQMGGGIGMDFSNLRPCGATVFRTGSESSGVIPFMHMWDAMCKTIMSSGSRRGAMMGTLSVYHPDIERFIDVKKKSGSLEMFNLSILIPDSFMRSVADDGIVHLKCPNPRVDETYTEILEEGGQKFYVYKTIKARDLWERITKSTYVYSEPGLIFIDRVNKLNNLYYCESISATNPCGEQPLPHNGCCNLGHINLAGMVKNSFTDEASIDWELLKETATGLTYFQDAVIENSLYPTEEQRTEALDKRRLGLGYTGLANMLQQLKVAYGTDKAVSITREVSEAFACAVYRASISLSKEKGSFPSFDVDNFLKASFVTKLPKDIRDGIRKHGIRNGVLLTIAPTGTSSIIAGNVSSGIEPVFAFTYTRKVLVKDEFNEDTKRQYEVYDYGYLKFYSTLHPDKELGSVPLPHYMNTAKDLTVVSHLKMVAAAQEWVDSAISKTVNVPTDLSYEDFKNIYLAAYSLGLKGCTTYRECAESGRMSVLQSSEMVCKTCNSSIPSNSGSCAICPICGVGSCG